MRRGFALLIIVAILGVLAALAANIFFISNQNRSLVSHFMHSVRANMIAQSGFEFSLLSTKDLSNFSGGGKKVSIGPGTYSREGDMAELTIRDLNGRININDGIQAGLLEIGETDYLGEELSKQLVPWPGQNSTVTADGSVDLQTNRSIAAFINLRIRRLLNAYGDVHRFVDHAFDDLPENVSETQYREKVPPDLVYSTRTPPSYREDNELDPDLSSPDGPRYTPMGDNISKVIGPNYNNGLGDRILSQRPATGFSSLNGIQDIVNKWSQDPGIELSDNYLKGGSFFELIKNDLTIQSFEDDQFFRLEKEHTFTFNKLSSGGKFGYQSSPFHGNIYTRFLDTTGGSGNNRLDINFLSKYQGSDFNSWKPHSAALINLTEASFFVRSAAFYAPTNVSYSCETAATLPPYSNSNLAGTNFNNDFFSEFTAHEAMIALPIIGTAPPVFGPELESLENGVPGVGRKTHLMSLRDAMHLAHQYDVYQSMEDKPRILNFDDFKDFLLWHTNNSTEAFPSFERARPLGSYSQGGEGKEDFNAGGLFHVSEYSDLSSPRPKYSEFSQDYVYRTLPHILSCIRRIPSYLNAPIALQSPFIILKPNEGSPTPDIETEQSFRKVEDFVWRSPLPKVCFLPCGFFNIKVQAKLLDPDNQEIASASLTKTLKAFETKYYRTQESFYQITDPDTHADIKTGPEFLTSGLLFPGTVASEYLGFVGLKDFDRDIDFDDETVNYKPQIVMNFNPYDPQDSMDGLQNLSPENSDGDYAWQEWDKDDWRTAVNADANYPDSYQSLGNSSMEGANQDAKQGVDFVVTGQGSGQARVFPNFTGQTTSFEAEGNTTDLSPFNGLSFSPLNGHSPVSKVKSFSLDDLEDIDGFDPDLVEDLEDEELDQFTASLDGQGGFVDSMYWRLTPWLKDKSIPTGENLSAGLITLWCRPPSGYSYPKRTGDTNFTNSFIPQSFSHVLVSLNLWESLTDQNPNFKMTRPIAITFGIKKTPLHGLNVFIRRDSGGPAHHSSADPVAYLGPSDFDTLEPSKKNPSPQYDFLGYLNLTPPAEPNIYASYRRAAYRSAEASVSLKNVPEAAGWIRLTGGWNLGWPGNHKLEKERQLWVVVHNPSIVESTQFREEGVFGKYPTGTGEMNPLEIDNASQYPGNEATSAGAGFMLPFDSTMTLSLGEAHARRLTEYPHYPPATALTEAGSPAPSKNEIEKIYLPFWRFTSLIDNARIWMGKSNPSSFPFNSDYLDPSSFHYQKEPGTLTNMRYNVTNASHLSSGYAEPDWLIDLKLQGRNQILSIGTRVYYPPDSTPQSPNTPYVKLSSLIDGDEVEPHSVMPKNEQDIFYPSLKLSHLKSSQYRLRFHYLAHRPNFNGKQSDTGGPVIYSGNDYCSNIAWGKEISTRLVPEGYPLIMSEAE